MNQLLANYDAARKAIFDHCGVPDDKRGYELETTGERWDLQKTAPYTYLVRYISPVSRSLESYKVRLTNTHDISVFPAEFRGIDVTLVLIDNGYEYPDTWLALDNAMEVKP